MENIYFQCLTVLNEQINLKHGANDKDMSQESGSTITSRGKLPNIVIPTFSGQYSEYVTFIGIFKSVIHTNKAIDNIQKLYYLRTFLKGQPYEFVKNLPLNSESYNEAMQLLHNRYYNKYKIISEHVNALLDLEKLSTFVGAKEIRQFVSTIRQNLAALNNLDANVDAWNPILLGIVTRKLDTYSARSYQLERNQEQEPTMGDLLAYMDKRALALENTDVKQDVAAPTTAKGRVSLAATAKPAMDCIYWKCMFPWARGLLTTPCRSLSLTYPARPFCAGTS
ncbi:uncharacterized protein LOC134201152 [Bombyx mori]|uniref:uncharacterized protein LOC134201152 n=1 Tax=Bombyx mori TaxID=7091 RepID=UPI002ED37156